MILGSPFVCHWASHHNKLLTHARVNVSLIPFIQLLLDASLSLLHLAYSTSGSICFFFVCFFLYYVDMANARVVCQTSPKKLPQAQFIISFIMNKKSSLLLETQTFNDIIKQKLSLKQHKHKFELLKLKLILMWIYTFIKVWYF